MIGWIFWICVIIILYIYIGYPVLLTLAAKTRPKPFFLLSPAPTKHSQTPASSSEPAASDQRPVYEPEITILIAAHNEEVFIARKLENSLSLNYPSQKLHILVIEDGSSDRTVEIVRSYEPKGVELHCQPQRTGKNEALNRSISLVRGEIVVLSDANNFYEPETLHALVAPFSDPKIGMVCGAKHILRENTGLSESESLYWKYEAYIKEQETRLSSCTAVTGEIIAIRRDLFEPIPPSIINEDFYRCMQILRRGYRVVFAPRAKSFERVSMTAQDEVTRRARINAGRFHILAEANHILPHHPVLLWQVISHKILRLFLPFFMIAALLANLIALIPHDAGVSPLLNLSQPVNWIFFGLQLLFYSMAWFGSRRKMNGKIGKLIYLPTFLVNSNLAALQGFFRYIKKRESPLWTRVRRAEESDKQNV